MVSGILSVNQNVSLHLTIIESNRKAKTIAFLKFNQPDDGDGIPKSSGAIVAEEVAKSRVTKVIMSAIERIKRDN